MRRSPDITMWVDDMWVSPNVGLNPDSKPVVRHSKSFSPHFQRPQLQHTIREYLQPGSEVKFKLAEVKCWYLMPSCHVTGCYLAVCSKLWICQCCTVCLLHIVILKNDSWDAVGQNRSSVSHCKVFVSMGSTSIDSKIACHPLHYVHQGVCQ